MSLIIKGILTNGLKVSLQQTQNETKNCGVNDNKTASSTTHITCQLLVHVTGFLQASVVFRCQSDHNKALFVMWLVVWCGRYESIAKMVLHIDVKFRAYSTQLVMYSQVYDYKYTVT